MRHLKTRQNGIAPRIAISTAVLALTACVAPVAASTDDPPAQADAPKAVDVPAGNDQTLDLPDSPRHQQGKSKSSVAPSNPATTSASTTAAPVAPAPSTSHQASQLTIGADRPGFGDTTTITPVGHLQLELGYTYTSRDRRGTETQTHNGPEILARVGLIADRLEIRVSTSGYVWSRTNDGSGNGFQNAEGMSDVAIGARLKICDQSGLIPRLAVGASTTIGVGRSGISDREVEPTARLIGSWDLGSNFSLTINGGASYLSPANGHFIQGFGSASLGFAATDRLSFFFEYFVVGPHVKGTDAAHSIDFGGAFLLTKRIQLDARLGFGLNQEADNLFAGAGLSVLF